MRLFGGLRPWLLQRLSAVYLLVGATTMALWAGSEAPLTFAQWRAAVSHPATMALVALWFTALFYHAWVGLRDVLLDYVHAPALRTFLLFVIALGLLDLELWVLMILAELHVAS